MATATVQLLNDGFQRRAAVIDLDQPEDKDTVGAQIFERKSATAESQTFVLLLFAIDDAARLQIMFDEFNAGRLQTDSIAPHGQAGDGQRQQSHDIEPPNGTDFLVEQVDGQDAMALVET